MKKKEKVPDYIKRQRNDWNGVNPITKIIPNKKKNPKIKHIKKEQEENYA